VPFYMLMQTARAAAVARPGRLRAGARRPVRRAGRADGRDHARRSRCTALAIGNNLAWSVVGGLTPLAATWLSLAHRRALAPAGWSSAAAAITLLALRLTADPSEETTRRTVIDMTSPLRRPRDRRRRHRQHARMVRLRDLRLLRRPDRPRLLPAENQVAQILAAFGIFAIGYLMRPLGGVVTGYIGDRLGRRAALTFSVAAMAIPTFLVGILPGYETLGIMAPVLLTVLRVIQGLSVGGEYTTAHGLSGRARAARAAAA
jgi:nitrate/nitrite transporter NarK